MERSNHKIAIPVKDKNGILTGKLWLIKYSLYEKICKQINSKDIWITHENETITIFKK